MPNLNKVMLMGRLTRDPESKALGNGTNMVSFSMAVNRVTGSGESRKEEVTFIPVTAFGKTADTIARYVAKGEPLYVEGRISVRKSEKDGQSRTYTNVIADTIQFLGGKKSDAAKSTSRAPQSYRGAALSEAGASSDDDEFADIPF